MTLDSALKAIQLTDSGIPYFYTLHGVCQTPAPTGSEWAVLALLWAGAIPVHICTGICRPALSVMG